MNNQCLLNVQSIFLESFYEYIKKGYSKMSVKVDFENITESCIIELKNSKIDRVLFFNFQLYSGPDKAFVAEFVRFWIDKEDNAGTSLLLRDYWRRIKGNEEHIPASLVHQGKGDIFEERLKNYFKIVKDTLENDLKAVVKGKEWIDLPFDFYPYK